ncbi:MAG: hypothetical protein LBK52_07615 [Deltaproteobacteria bacterium]|nr:hypothetical protein [Deltaproteobacteria bacterium]
MAHISLQNTQNGRTYINYVNAYWDKELKSPRNRKILIGKLDQDTGLPVFNSKFFRIKGSIPGLIELLKEKFMLDDSFDFDK